MTRAVQPVGEAIEAFEQAMCGRPWRIRVRGDVDRLTTERYRCRRGHEFDMDVPLSLVPDEVPCATCGGPRDCRSSAQHIVWKGNAS